MRLALVSLRSKKSPTYSPTSHSNNVRFEFVLILCIDIVAEIVVRVFFSLLHFIMMGLLETEFDFYQFRWLICLFLNQLLILFSINVNPLHSLALLGILTYPLMSILKVQDLRKVDPFS